MIRAFLLCFFLALPTSVLSKSIFYQPHDVDGELTDGEWAYILAETKKAGFDRLIVQWVRFGSSDFGGHGGWLERLVTRADSEGLDVVLGLYADPDFFKRVRGGDSELAAYLNGYLVKNLSVLDEVSGQPFARDVVGWYLPAEFDDRYWLSDFRKGLLQDQLAKWDKVVASRTRKPWSTSSFFTGWQTPENYSHWLNGLDYELWIQDGSGTAVLTSDQRTLYLEQIGKVRSGIIVEAFSQVSRDGEFSATSRAPEDLLQLEEAYRALGFERVGYFSLRYMPFARDLLCRACDGAR